MIARGDLLLRNNGLPLRGSTGVINRLIITGLFPCHRPHFWILLESYLGTSFFCQSCSCSSGAVGRHVEAELSQPLGVFTVPVKSCEAAFKLFSII